MKKLITVRLKAIISIFLVLSVVLVLSACGVNNEPPKTPSSSMPAKPISTVPDISGIWEVQELGTVLVLNDNSMGSLIFLGEREDLPDGYDVRVNEFVWKYDKDYIRIYPVGSDLASEPDEELSYKVSGGKLHIPDLADEYPFEKVPSNFNAKNNIVGEWKLYGTDDAFITFESDGSWNQTDSMGGMIHGKYTIDSLDVSISSADGSWLGDMRILGNGLIAYNDNLHIWLLQY